MSKEILETKELSTNFAKEKELLEKAGVLEILNNIIEDKKMSKSIIQESDKEMGKYIVDFNFGFEGDSGQFCKEICFSANLKEKEIIINGLKTIKINQENWKKKRFLEKKIIKSLKTPIKRSKMPFLSIDREI